MCRLLFHFLFTNFDVKVLTLQLTEICRFSKSVAVRELGLISVSSLYILIRHFCAQDSALQCFDAVGWVAGRASGL